MAEIKPVMNNSLLSDYYDILEVDKNASLKEIREAYLSLCKDLHPDKLPADSGQNLRKLAEERLKLINEAYETLKDEDLRSEYDQAYGISINKDSIKEPTDNTKESADSLEDLLSSSVLSEGRANLQHEEQIIWLHYIKEIDKIEDHYGRYLRRVKGHTSRYFYPDTPILRLDRFARILYSGVPFVVVMSGIVTGLLLFLVILALLVILVALNIIGLRFDFPVFNIKPILIGIFLLIATYSMSDFIFEEDKTNNGNRKAREESNCIFLDELNSHWSASTTIGSYYRMYKLKRPMYKKDYVKAARDIEKQLQKEISSIIENRKEKIEKFKQVNPYKLTPKYLSSLSVSERFLLIKAFEQKAKDEKGEESRNNALKVAGAVGLLALWIGTGGTFGP